MGLEQFPRVLAVEGQSRRPENLFLNILFDKTLFWEQKTWFELFGVKNIVWQHVFEKKEYWKQTWKNMKTVLTKLKVLADEGQSRRLVVKGLKQIKTMNNNLFRLVMFCMIFNIDFRIVFHMFNCSMFFICFQHVCSQLFRFI